MQLTPRYLVNNKTTIVTNEAGFITEYKPVYSRQLQVYKGIDNVLQFKVLNHDQKPVDITAKAAKLVVYDQNKLLIIEKTGTILDDGSTTTRGNISVTINENDLLNIDQQYLSYNVYLVESDNTKTLTYTDTHFGASGVIYVSGQAFPGPAATHSITTFTEDNTKWVSEALDAQPGINGNEALHTAAVYTNEYVGGIKVYATLENQVDDGTKWAEVASTTFIGTETTPSVLNFNGVYTFLRLEADANPSSKVTKILVRN